MPSEVAYFQTRKVTNGNSRTFPKTKILAEVTHKHSKVNLYNIQIQISVQ